MNFNLMDSAEFFSGLKLAVKNESAAILVVLDYLREAEARRFYAEKGYSSLFAFCLGELRYSESAANRRISAMRLMKSVPEAREKLCEGAVNLSTLTQLQKFVKDEEKRSCAPVLKQTKLELLAEIENKTQREVETGFVARCPDYKGRTESTRPASEEFTEIKFRADRALMAKLGKLRNLMARKNIGGHAELISELCDIALEKLDPAAREARSEARKSTKKSEVAADEKVEKTSFAAEAKARSRYVPAALRRKVWVRDQGKCQFVDEETGKKCESAHGLEIDHVIAFAKGGAHSVENLRLLCFAHNQLQAMREFSSAHMAQFVPR